MLQKINDNYVLFVYLYSSKENLFCKNYYLQFVFQVRMNMLEMVRTTIDEVVNIVGDYSIESRMDVQTMNVDKRAVDISVLPVKLLSASS